MARGVYIRTEEHKMKMRGRVFSEETRRKIGEASKGRPSSMKGKHHSAESIMKMSEAHKGHIISEGTKEKMKLWHKNHKNPNLGKPMSEEQKRKISERLMGRHLSEEHKKHISESNAGVPKPISEEARQKLIESNKNRIWTDEAKRKISEAHKGKPSGMKGKHHTNEAKEKMSKARLGVMPWIAGKKHSDEAIKKMSEIITRQYRDGTRIHPFLGKHRSKEVKIKISKKLVGNKINLGRFPSQESKIKMSKSHLGKPSGMKGKHQTNESRKKMREKRLNQIFPKKDTKPEREMQQILSELGIDFVTHKVIGNIQHKYQCDVFIPKENTVIEVDGKYWHNYPNGREIDHIRTKEMQDAGYKVLRFWEDGINEKNVLEKMDLFAIDVG